MKTTPWTLAALWLLTGTGFSALITIDSVTRSVTTTVTGGTADSRSSHAVSDFDVTASTTDGVDSGISTAGQNSILSAGSTFRFSNVEDVVVTGSRGFGIAPVNVAAESLVDVTFTIPAEVGAAAFVFDGFYTVIGGEFDGTPSVAWSLASVGETVIGGAVLGGTLSSGSATSGTSTPINASGLLWPGTYNLSLEARMGNTGSGLGSFSASGSFGAAALQDINLVVTPLIPVPEPSSTLLVGLACSLWLRRRR